MKPLFACCFCRISPCLVRCNPAAIYSLALWTVLLAMAQNSMITHIAGTGHSDLAVCWTCPHIICSWRYIDLDLRPTDRGNVSMSCLTHIWHLQLYHVEEQVSEHMEIWCGSFFLSNDDSLVILLVFLSNKLLCSQHLQQSRNDIASQPQQWQKYFGELFAILCTQLFTLS